MSPGQPKLFFAPDSDAPVAPVTAVLNTYCASSHQNWIITERVLQYSHREMALPIASHLQIPAKNVFCNTMSWQLDDNGEPIRLQVCGSPASDYIH